MGYQVCVINLKLRTDVISILKMCMRLLADKKRIFDKITAFWTCKKIIFDKITAFWTLTIFRLGFRLGFNIG